MPPYTAAVSHTPDTKEIPSCRLVMAGIRPAIFLNSGHVVGARQRRELCQMGSHPHHLAGSTGIRGLTTRRANLVGPGFQSLAFWRSKPVVKPRKKIASPAKPSASAQIRPMTFSVGVMVSPRYIDPMNVGSVAAASKAIIHQVSTNSPGPQTRLPVSAKARTSSFVSPFSFYLRLNNRFSSRNGRQLITSLRSSQPRRA